MNYSDNILSNSPLVKNTNDQANCKTLWTKESSSNSDNGWMVPYKYYAVKGPISDSNPNVDSSSWVLCNEVQLKDISLKRMEIIYKDTVSKLVALGHNEDIAVKAILLNVHCYGSNDLATDLLHYTLACLEEGSMDMYEFKPAFSDLKKLEEHTLKNLVSLLQEVRLELGEGDAMWCLLMNDYNVLKAITIHVPFVSMFPPPLTELENEERGFRKGGSDIPLKGFFCGKEMTVRLQRDIEFPKKFDLTPAMICSLKSNVVAFADGYKANSKQVQPNEGKFPGISTVSKLDSSSASVATMLGDLPGDSHNMNDQDDLKSVLSKFHHLNIDENLEFVAEDEKDSVIVTLVHQIKDLEKQVKERKDWAHEKAIQAARKLNGYLIELKTFRIEREENQRLKKGKEANEELEDPTMVRLLELEEALRKVCGQTDLATAGVGKLETEKSEIKAELEACKLSASEYVASCLQIAKREKKCLKKLLAWEKQEAKIKQNISDEKQKILEIQEELAQIKQRAKEAEVMRDEELKAKEEALALIEEERRSMEAAEANRKRNLKALSLKMEIDFQRRKDDLLRLEQEISCLKASAQSATLPTCESEEAEPHTEIIAKLLQELDNVPDFFGKEATGNTYRECVICGKYEVSVVFLPCAHQVMCASCSEEYGRNGKAVCPCCWVPIEQRIRTFGGSS
ncbi:MND1-interacting protein 1-like isoform X1 [Vigna umbellata]|uniref:MND1-interacting protein 1-like isoform X1 n=1 Tax=Vigna umbellata TaxID=87088 RepID=UPI001F5F6248|nr:MND1-interacting protein 1-like isoform X1 [Vigna umbellata]